MTSAPSVMPDLYFSFLMWRNDTTQHPELLLSPTARYVPVRASKIQVEGVSFDFDPSLTTLAVARKQVDDAVTRIRREALLQVTAAQKAAARAGWAEFSGRHRSPEERRVLLARVYKRAAKGLVWDQVVDGENADLPAVQESVFKLAALLGVSLPRTRGRLPRGQKGRFREADP